MIIIHPIQTGLVKIKSGQRKRKKGGLLRVLLDAQWTEWLPIYAWAIVHPEGVIAVDTGDTARTMEPSYFPRWHPYYLKAVRFRIAPEQEVGAQLRQIGIQPREVRKVILTHFHTDHAGGLHHFPDSEVLVSSGEYESAQGLRGRLQGYLPHRWPSWLRPSIIHFTNDPIGPFKRSFALTKARDVLVVPTPGHTPNHMSVIVRTKDTTYFLAGDTSYTQDLLLAREPDGVSPKRKQAIHTIDNILAFARQEPTIYLPSHDPDSVDRLNRRITLFG